MHIQPDSPTTPEMVRWAFHTILGHYVVTDAVIEFHQRVFPSFKMLCEGLQNSSEFAASYAARSVQLAAWMPDAAIPTVIASLYRSHLHREPSPDELAETAALLNQMGGLAAVGELASILGHVLRRPGPGPATGEGQLRTALPERPPAPWQFIGRERQMDRLLHWFMRGDRRRLFLEGPDEAGRTTLAAEFGRRLAAAGRDVLLPGGARLGHVIFVGGDAADGGAAPAAQILHLSRWARELIDDPAVIEREMTDLLAASNGLIILDGRSDADERLLTQILAANRHNKLLYVHAPGQISALDQSIEVAGFSDEAEYEAFLAGCAARFGTAAPTKAEYDAIARWSHGLPGRIEKLFGLRRGTGSFIEAIATAGEGRQ